MQNRPIRRYLGVYFVELRKRGRWIFKLDDCKNRRTLFQPECSNPFQSLPKFSFFCRVSIKRLTQSQKGDVSLRSRQLVTGEWDKFGFDGAQGKRVQASLTLYIRTF